MGDEKKVEWYLCKLKPLEPFFLGGERTFDFSGEAGGKSEDKTSYYICSEKWPNQSTILGTMRFLVLKKHNMLHDRDKQNEANEKDYIGEHSFILSNKEQKYGKIKEISPVFLMDKYDNKWIRTPYNHKVKKDKNNYNESYVPMERLNTTVSTYLGEVRLLKDYNTKDGLTDSVMKITDRSIRNVEEYPGVHGVLKNFERVGIARQSDEEGFFKKQYWTMNESFSFAFYCKAEEGAFERQEVVYLGQGKSVFRFTAEEATTDDPLNSLEDSIRNCCAGNDEFWYALSDVYLESIDNKGFSIVKKKYFRSLVQADGTKNGENISFRMSKKRSRLYELIEAGSVFYYDPFSENENQEGIAGYKQVGLNHVIKVGGKSNEE